jgi:glycosyltransferase involved in cell wall biosynthesis
MNRLYYLGKPADGFGWGVANANLVRELELLCEVIVEESNREHFDAPVFVPVADSTLKPLRKVKAPRVLGYCFTEWPLTDNARVEAGQYDVLFAGSTWNVQKLRDAGIKHVEPLLQGIDFERFKVHPPSERKGFVVFSGGKYEFRKGQDYVIAAMRHFMKMRGDAVLLTAWHNQWKESVRSMNNSPLIDPAEPLKDLPRDRVIDVPLIPNANTPKIYAQAHIGLFPNRCEAGTNLVMCEFMACGRPVIASCATGQRDVLGGRGPYLLTNGSYDPAGWFNPNVSDIIAHLEHAYQNREELSERGLLCRNLIEPFTWKDCAVKIFNAAFLPFLTGEGRDAQPPVPESQPQANHP